MLFEEDSEIYSAILYHGTTQQFSEFDHDLITSHGPYGNGIYLTNDYGLARQYAEGQEPMKVRVTLQKPYCLDLSDPTQRDRRAPFRSSEGKQQLVRDGYDGVVVTEDNYIEVVAYRSATLEIIS